MNARGLMIAVCLAGLILAMAGCDVVSGPGTLTGAVTYAKDPAKPLTDPGNAGAPAAGIKVIIYGTDKQNVPGQDVYVENKMPAKEITTDGQGRYTAELPSGRYVVRLGPDPKSYHQLADIGPARTMVMDFIILPPGVVLPTPTLAPTSIPGPTPTLGPTSVPGPTPAPSAYPGQ
jgi:hypothetical protein